MRGAGRGFQELLEKDVGWVSATAFFTVGGWSMTMGRSSCTVSGRDTWEPQHNPSPPQAERSGIHPQTPCPWSFLLPCERVTRIQQAGDGLYGELRPCLDQPGQQTHHPIQ